MQMTLIFSFYGIFHLSLYCKLVVPVQYREYESGLLLCLRGVSSQSVLTALARCWEVVSSNPEGNSSSFPVPQR